MKINLLYLILMLFCVSTNAKQHMPRGNILFNAFKQGNVNGGGNCASIALIKAFIETFGVGEVFKLKKNNIRKILSVKLKDNNSILYLLSYSENDVAIKENGFKIKSQLAVSRNIKSYADTCFAVMVKVNEKIRDYDSFEESLSSLLNGYNTLIFNAYWV